MHTEQVGPEGVAYLSGRRRYGGPLTREAFESDLRRESFEVIHGGQKPNFTEDLHAHGGFNVRIMVLSGEITVIRNGGSETFHAGIIEIPGEVSTPRRWGRKALLTSLARSIGRSPPAELQQGACWSRSPRQGRSPVEPPGRAAAGRVLVARLFRPADEATDAAAVRRHGR